MELPTGFANANDKLSIKHIKDNGTVEYYTGKVTADGGKLYLTFTTNGFSPFVISSAVASIDGVMYPTLRLWLMLTAVRPSSWKQIVRRL